MIKQIKTGRSVAAKKEDEAQVRATVETMLGEIEARGEAAVREYSKTLDVVPDPRHRYPSHCGAHRYHQGTLRVTRYRDE